LTADALGHANIGAVAMGAMTGLATALLLFLVMGVTGIVDSPSDAVPLLFLQFLGLVLAGFVSGRLSGRDQALHGGYAGLLLFLVATMITLAADPDSASLLVIAFTGALSLVLGSAGGTLARALEE
jgi:putative membrane protein (TIGR04086 family)